MSQCKIFFLVLAILTACLLACIVQYFFFIETYRKAPIGMRSPYEFNAVIARYYQFDSMIMGTSMSQNFKCSEFDRVCGGFSQKLTVPGCSIEKLCFIMEYACKYHRIKAVMTDLHNEFVLKKPPGWEADDMYYSDNDFWGNIRDGVSLQTLLARLKYYTGELNIGKKEKKIGQEFSRDDLYNWEKDRKFGKLYVAQELMGPVLPRKFMHPKYAVININNFLIPMVKNHPNTRFYFFLPPFTLFAYDVWKEFLAARKIVLDQLTGIPNVELYDFQGAAEVVLNLDNYCDLTHYSGKISSWILEQMQAGNYRVTPENRHEFDLRFESLLKSFDPAKEKAVLISLLNKPSDSTKKPSPEKQK